jgi:uncharacterized protein
MLLLQLLNLFLLFYGSLLLFVFVYQKKFIFYPTRARHNMQNSIVAPLSLTNEEETLQGWIVHSKFAEKKIILYFGGNAEDIFYSIDQFVSFADTAAVLVHYRGYGTSTGTPGEKELFSDASAIFDHIIARYAPEKIFLMGRGLGSAVACHVAAQRRTTGIILIAPFDSLEYLVKRKLPFLPASLILRHKFRTLESVKNIDSPALILYGGQDRIVPPKQTENLIRYMKGPKKLVYLEEAEHNTLEHFAEYNLKILQFIQ